MFLPFTASPFTAKTTPTPLQTLLHLHPHWQDTTPLTYTQTHMEHRYTHTHTSRDFAQSVHKIQLKMAFTFRGLYWPCWWSLGEVGGGGGITQETAKLPASLFYNTLPPTSAMTDYTIGLWKPPANGQRFLRARTAVSLLPSRNFKLHHTAFLPC